MPKEKIPDNEFCKIFSENGGLYTKTSVAIEKKFNIPYSRQAVFERAQRYPELLKEIEEKNIEIAHNAFIELMQQKDNLEVRFKTARYYAQTKGKAQFNTKLEEKPPYELKEQIIKIGNNVLKFLTPWKEK
jgi:hypothetical protein